MGRGEGGGGGGGGRRWEEVSSGEEPPPPSHGQQQGRDSHAQLPRKASLVSLLVAWVLTQPGSQGSSGPYWVGHTGCTGATGHPQGRVRGREAAWTPVGEVTVLPLPAPCRPAGDVGRGALRF